MMVILKRKTLIFTGLVILLVIALYGLNISSGAANTVTASIDGVKRVVIDPGHGGEDPGAVSDISKTSEKNINLYIGLKVKELLEKEGIEVIMTRTEDKLEYTNTKSETNMRHQDLTRRKKLMDESNANVVVSIHLNKFPQTSVHGAQVFFPNDPKESRDLAVCLQQTLKEVVEPGNSREALIKREPLIILKEAKVPTAIVECGFLSNAEEEKKLTSVEYQDKLAEAIKTGILKYINGNKS